MPQRFRPLVALLLAVGCSSLLIALAGSLLATPSGGPARPVAVQR